MSRFLVIFLALLQLFSPLVHAHTGKYRLHNGLHIPELEFFNADTEKRVLQGVDSYAQSDGMVIDVCAGLKFDNLSPDSTDIAYFESKEKYFCDHVLLRINFSPHLPAPITQISSSPSSPRAPPV